jgi:hypothetical protein
LGRNKKERNSAAAAIKRPIIAPARGKNINIAAIISGSSAWGAGDLEIPQAANRPRSEKAKEETMTGALVFMKNRR